MAKSRKKKDQVPYEFIERVNKMDAKELVKAFIREEEDIKALELQRKSDDKLAEINAMIKAQKEEVSEELETLKEKIKELLAGNSVDELKEDRKALVKGYNEEIKRRKAFRNFLYETMARAYPQ